MVQISVGFETFTHYELGFDEAFSIPTVERDYHELYVHILRRLDEPLVVITSRNVISVADFADARTPELDYPTLPFLRMIKILEAQQEVFMDKIADAMREHRVPCCSAVSYIADIVGLLRFALQRRGVDVEVSVCCWPSDIPRKLSEIRKVIKRAEEPAPFLGNTVYIEIAERAYQLLKITTRFMELLPVWGGCSCTC